ncbi:MAG: aminodeoxychorismate lyase, partial [Comamonadaceae bacterium]
MRRFLALVLVIILAAGATAAWWLHAPMPVGPRAGVTANEPLELAIEPGTTPRGVAQAVAAAGVAIDARVLYAWFRVSGQDRAIKAGN